MIFMADQKILDAIKKSKEGSKKNFQQSFDLAVNLRGLDLKKPENKIKLDVVLPHGKGKPVKIGLFADSLIPQTRSLEGIVVVRKDEIEALAKNKKQSKRLARECDAFISESTLMPSIGRYLGQILGPLNKMPQPIPPAIPDIKPVLERSKKTLKLALKDSPVFHCIVGKESMEEEKVAENIEAVLRSIESALPNGKDQIKDAYIKLTMGKAVKIG